MLGKRLHRTRSQIDLGRALLLTLSQKESMRVCRIEAGLIECLQQPDLQRESRARDCVEDLLFGQRSGQLVIHHGSAYRVRALRPSP